MNTMRVFITAHPLVATALSSLWGAVLIDLIAFAGSKDPGGFFATFNFKAAGWKYLQGLVGGAVGTAVVAGGASAVAIAIYALGLWRF